MMSAKAHNIKMWMRFSEGCDQPIVKPQFPIVFDLGSDPGERANLFFDKMDIGWEAAIVLPAFFQYVKSFEQYPNIKPGEEFTGYRPAPPKSA